MTGHHSVGGTVPSYLVGEMAAGETIVEGSAQGNGGEWLNSSDVCTIKCQEEGENAGRKESEAASVYGTEGAVGTDSVNKKRGPVRFISRNSLPSHKWGS